VRQAGEGRGIANVLLDELVVVEDEPVVGGRSQVAIVRP